MIALGETRLNTNTNTNTNMLSYLCKRATLKKHDIQGKRKIRLDLRYIPQEVTSRVLEFRDQITNLSTFFASCLNVVRTSFTDYQSFDTATSN